MELASMAAAVILFGLYLFLLRMYDEKNVSTFKDSPFFYLFGNLQSAVAFITTLLRCFMLYPVASAMGQLKWHYFQRSSARRISDLQAFEEASRGILGSFQLIFSRNAFTYYNSSFRNDLNGESKFLDVNSHMQASVLSGWAWRCKWDSYSTLAVGTQCLQADYTVEDDNRFAFSKQANVTNRFQQSGTKDGFARIVMKVDGTIPPDSKFTSDRESNNPAVIFHFAAIAHNEDGTFEAVECLIYWQVWIVANATYNSSTLDLNETIVEKVSNGVVLKDPNPSRGYNISIPAPCHYKDETICNYSVDARAHRGLQNALASFFIGRDVIWNESTDNLVAKQDDIMTRLFSLTWLRAMRKPRNLEKELPLLRTVKSYLKNVALSITENIRIQSAMPPVKGEQSLSVQFFTVRYVFVLHPAIMLGLSLLLFFSTIWRTREQEVWKTSQLPLLYHGFALPVLDEAGKLANLGSMEAV
ncbi:hypothetical protein LX36DRAFT_700379 [Colletotrichum falcatum]|nr:hypothetical protein LX36DRAFT_700379 [Colletotrichum falcatum]